jgi:hypothetical protein
MQKYGFNMFKHEPVYGVFECEFSGAWKSADNLWEIGRFRRNQWRVHLARALWNNFGDEEGDYSFPSLGSAILRIQAFYEQISHDEYVVWKQTHQSLADERIRREQEKNERSRKEYEMSEIKRALKKSLPVIIHGVEDDSGYFEIAIQYLDKGPVRIKTSDGAVIFVGRDIIPSLHAANNCLELLKALEKAEDGDKHLGKHISRCMAMCQSDTFDKDSARWVATRLRLREENEKRRREREEVMEQLRRKNETSLKLRRSHPKICHAGVCSIYVRYLDDGPVIVTVENAEAFLHDRAVLPLLDEPKNALEFLTMLEKNNIGKDYFQNTTKRFLEAMRATPLDAPSTDPLESAFAQD